MRQRVEKAAAMAGFVSLALVLAGCSLTLGGDDTAIRREQAQTELASWDKTVAEATAAGGQTDFVPTQPLGGVIGDWGDKIDGGNAKMALGAGLLETEAPLPDQAPPDAQLQWPDGTGEAFRLLSAKEALAQLTVDADWSCADCTPLRVTAATLTIGTVSTSRGPVQAPIWEFSIASSPALITYLAIAKPLTVAPGGTYGAGMQSAARTSDPRLLTVTFTGMAAPGQGGCTAGYTAEAVESDTALVVIVSEHPDFNLGMCDAVGYIRTATVSLSKPLGNRTVLSGGQPVEVLPNGSPSP